MMKQNIILHLVILIILAILSSFLSVKNLSERNAKTNVVAGQILISVNDKNLTLIEYNQLKSDLTIKFDERESKIIIYDDFIDWLAIISIEAQKCEGWQLIEINRDNL